MSARLGEMLLKVGALTEAQLEQVLNAQSIYGGRLGTNLVEMGLVGEEDLARVLSEQLGVPCVEPAGLVSIPEALLCVIPRHLVERYRVLPLSLDGKRLTLATADPSDFKAMEEIGFVTGFIIVPRVCSELRLSLALERFYDIKRPVRYIPVEGGVRSRFAPAGIQAAADLQGDSSWDGEGADFPMPDRVGMKELAEQLAGASGEAQVVRALLGYLAGEFDRGGIVRFVGEDAVGVQAVEWGVPVDGFGGYAAPLHESALLRRVLDEKRLYLGLVAGEGGEGGLIAAMGGKVPGAALLVPVCLGGQVAALICASDQRGRLGGGAFELQRVAVMAELSFEMLALKKRILTG